MGLEPMGYTAANRRTIKLMVEQAAPLFEDGSAPMFMNMATAVIEVAVGKLFYAIAPIGDPNAGKKRLFLRVNTAPYYEDQGDAAAPGSQAQIDAAAALNQAAVEAVEARQDDVELTLSGALSSSSYRPTPADGADLPIGTYFLSPNAGDGGTVWVYQRVAGAPGYTAIQRQEFSADQIADGETKVSMTVEERANVAHVAATVDSIPAFTEPGTAHSLIFKNKATAEVMGYVSADGTEWNLAGIVLKLADDGSVSVGSYTGEPVKLAPGATVEMPGGMQMLSRTTSNVWTLVNTLTGLIGGYVGANGEAGFGGFTFTPTDNGATMTYDSVPVVTVDATSVTFHGIADGGSTARYALSNAPVSATVTTHTDGRSLNGWRAARSRVKTGTGTAKILISGDSWSEQRRIPQAFAGILQADMGDAGAGWISVFSDNIAAGNDLGPLGSATFSKSGWTTYDASENGGPNATIGCSHEGEAIYTTGSAATATYGFTGTAFKLYYPQLTGSLQYRVDGGGWTAILSNGGGSLGILSVTGLSSGAHTVEVNTATNTGGLTAAIYGLYYYTTGATGVEVLKCGNAAIDALQFERCVTRVPPIMASLAPDVIAFLLGTNDCRRPDRSPAVYIDFISKYVAAIRAVLPNVGFVFTVPARTQGGTIYYPLSDYRDALSKWCMENGCEFYNMYDEWGEWLPENTAGQWFDGLHVSNAGAYRVANRINRLFLAS